MFDRLGAKALNVLRLLLIQTIGSELPYQFEGPDTLLKSYDFVVVGAGAGGCAVAARLSELSDVRVLLLEAGGPAQPETALPVLAGYAPGTDFGMMTSALPGQQFGLINNSFSHTQGRVMGGSTVRNAMIYARGNYRDYDNWAKLGNLGWDYASVLPYFKKLEDFKGYETPETDKYRGRGGPVTVEKKRHSGLIARRLYEAAQELGYRIIDDAQPRQIGLAPHHFSAKNGLRTTASESYLRPIVGRKNLHIQPEATVTRIIFNKTKHAIGVEFMLKGKLRRVRASKEVVVSAGVFNTPKLLMLSGVGPKRHLEDLGIPVVAAVEGMGQNLQDHPGLNYLPFAAGRGQGMSLAQIKDYLNIDTLDQFLINRTGILSSMLTECNGFFSFESSDPDWADVYISTASIPPLVDLGLLSQPSLGVKDEFFRPIYLPLVTAASQFVFNVAVARPKSRGWVKLKSRHHEDNPLIYFNYLDDPNDVRLLVKGIRFMFALMRTRAMKQRAEARYISLPVPACSQWPHLSDGYWECLSRALVSTNWHPCGTCRMAPDSDPLGVVNSRLQLRGVSGVRVVDASIIPEIITSNTQATSYMIGEKGADLIKQDWGYPTDPPS